MTSSHHRVARLALAAAVPDGGSHREIDHPAVQRAVSELLRALGAGGLVRDDASPRQELLALTTRTAHDQ